MASLRVPNVVPTPTQDSERLKKAFKGWGADEEGVIWVLGHRNASQRKKIRETYEQLYKESLIDRLHSEVSGDFRKAIILWTLDPPERDAKLANEALQKMEKGIKYLQMIIEISCASSPDHLMAVRQAYCSTFDCSLEEHITTTVTPPLRKLLLGLVSSYRHDREVVDATVADSEASVLHDAIKKKQLDQDDVVWVLSTRNMFQLRATFECYKHKYGNPIDQDIKESGTSDLLYILRMLICCIDTPEKHFAEVVKKSVSGVGTHENSLTRVVVTRAEVDAMKIKEEYSKMYKTSLEKAVIGDTSGDYKNFLVTLLGGRF